MQRIPIVILRDGATGGASPAPTALYAMCGVDTLRMQGSNDAAFEVIEGIKRVAPDDAALS
jgi:hypothetical protein